MVLLSMKKACGLLAELPVKLLFYGLLWGTNEQVYLNMSLL